LRSLYKIHPFDGCNIALWCSEGLQDLDFSGFSSVIGNRGKWLSQLRVFYNVKIGVKYGAGVMPCLLTRFEINGKPVLILMMQFSQECFAAVKSFCITVIGFHAP